MEYPECLNGRCAYNEEYRCKAEGISEDIICQQGKDDALSQFIKTESGDDDIHGIITEGQNRRMTDKENLCPETE